ncbi:hypothetical protein [Desulfatitalea tepidiphila]|uniref:hypothetical protein n=1 Tax=Desulfatitalea tepidiphila TaxID=1185843 RepID=UPI00128FBBB8|nr:hypothetical protein [Desulfatitalea tepidiphila]
MYVFTAFPLALGTAVRKRRLQCLVQLTLGRLNIATASDERVTLGFRQLFEKVMCGADVACKPHDEDIRYWGFTRSRDARHPPFDSIAIRSRSPDAGWTNITRSDDQAGILNEFYSLDLAWVEQVADATRQAVKCR